MAEHFGITSLVSSNGDIQESDSDEEADMCEFIRAAVAAGKFKETGEMDNLNDSFIGKINCAGSPS